jgi:hypothetical protein
MAAGAMCEPIVYKMWEPRRLTALWASTACYRDSFTFFTFTGRNLPFYLFYIFIKFAFGQNSNNNNNNSNNNSNKINTRPKRIGWEFVE